MLSAVCHRCNANPDYVLYNASTGQTVRWFLTNNVLLSGYAGPTLPANWRISGIADFNRDGEPDYALFNPSTLQTVIWYFSGPKLLSGAAGPTLPYGWQLVATADFNNDGKPDYVLYRPATRETTIWYMNNNVRTGGGAAPTLAAGWSIVGAADFNRDGKTDYLLFNAATGQSKIVYLSGATILAAQYGPTIPNGYQLAGTSDFNNDGKPDYLLYNPTTGQTVIWYLDNNVLLGGALGPTLPAGWNVIPSSSRALPRGVFSLGQAGGSINPAVLSNPAVPGVTLRLHWCDLEPAEGIYNWNYFDSQIARAGSAHKKVVLTVGTGGDNIPAWVMSAVKNAGGATFTFTDSSGSHTIPVFWDATLLAKKGAMIAALGARYSSNPAVQGVRASFANASSDDWSVPHNTVVDPGYTTSEVTRWRLAGYSSQKMIDAGNYVLDATMNAFPYQAAVLPINSNGNTLDAPNDGNYVARTVIANVRARWGAQRLFVARNNISAVTAPAPPPADTTAGLWYSSRPTIAAQSLWFSYGDTTYRNNGGTPIEAATSLWRIVNVARSYGVSYLELYETDVVNLPLVIQYAHTAL